MLTRRSFTAALGGAISAQGRRLRIGIGTYSYHSVSMAAMVRHLRVLDVREIEMSRGEFMLLSRPKPALFESARALFDQAEIHCVSYYAATFKEESEVEQAVRFARILGARNITGDAVGEGLLNRIDRACTDAGLTFGIHNHYFKQKFAYESPEDVLKVLAGRSATMGATADVGQFVSCGHDPVEAVRTLAPRLKLVHLKDIARAGGEDNVLLGRGVAKIPEVLALLKSVAFAGLVAVEYEKEGPVEDDMRRQVDYARRLS
jgi:inosose dehydratase